MANLRLEWLNAADLKDNPRNWRRHPPAQAQALKELLEDPEVGWAGVLLYNERTQQLIDGHLRKEIIVDGKVPVVIGSWSEEGERRILATLDPIAYMAEHDHGMLTSLIESTTFQSAAVNALIAGLVKTEPVPQFAPASIDDQGRLDEKVKVTCPECGHEFTP